MNDRKYIYTYVRHTDEYELCSLEMRSFFGFDVKSNVLMSDISINPSRSPFIKERLAVMFEDESFEKLLAMVENVILTDTTFKVVCLNTLVLDATPKIGHPKRRKLEREIGLRIQGEPDLDHAQTIFGVLQIGASWYFGELTESEAVWFTHQQKPHMYSTALSTHVARAVANIAAPHPVGISVIDPCCGIGTVLVEALSMGINIVGRDINPLVVLGSRKNIAHFGLEGEVTVGPIADVTEEYDVGIIDMPYNLFTHISVEGQFAIIKEARRFAKKLIVITIDTIDHMIIEAGYTITDRCVVKKGHFERQILVCQ